MLLVTITLIHTIVFFSVLAGLTLAGMIKLELYLKSRQYRREVMAEDQLVLEMYQELEEESELALAQQAEEAFALYVEYA